jgi:ATP-dependent RNA helicase HelY
MSLGPRDFPSAPDVVARVALPLPYAPTDHRFQRQVASALVAAELTTTGRAGLGEAERRRGELATAREEAAAAHPVAGCPDARSHLRALDRADRLAREAERLERRIRGRSDSLARQFDRVLGVLRSLHYVDGWTLSDRGQRLARLYHECDLLIAESIDQGLLDGLGPAELAGLTSVFTFEARGQAPPDRSLPSGRLRDRWVRIERLALQLNVSEERAGLPLTRVPDPGFARAADAWARGEELAGIIEGGEISGGDFVRNVKQLIDLLRQIGELAPDRATAATARQAADQLFRGVVAASSIVAT